MGVLKSFKEFLDGFRNAGLLARSIVSDLDKAIEKQSSGEINDAFCYALSETGVPLNGKQLSQVLRADKYNLLKERVVNYYKMHETEAKATFPDLDLSTTGGERALHERFENMPIEIFMMKDCSYVFKLVEADHEGPVMLTFEPHAMNAYTLAKVVQEAFNDYKNSDKAQTNPSRLLSEKEVEYVLTEVGSRCDKVKEVIALRAVGETAKNFIQHMRDLDDALTLGRAGKSDAIDGALFAMATTRSWIPENMINSHLPKDIAEAYVKMCEKSPVNYVSVSEDGQYCIKTSFRDFDVPNIALPEDKLDALNIVALAKKALEAHLAYGVFHDNPFIKGSEFPIVLEETIKCLGDIEKVIAQGFCIDEAGQENPSSAYHDDDVR